MLDRRQLSTGLLGLGLTPGVAGAAPGVVEGATTWSESVMALYFDESLHNGFSLRLSRYPDSGATWVWCHVLVDGVLYAFTERRLACSKVRTTATQALAVYDAPGLEVRMTRVGPSAAMTALSFSASVRGHKSKSGVDGPGDTAISVEGIFRPGLLRGNSPEGRFERTGMFEANLRAGPRRVFVSGMGKAHEQTQTNPRFFRPFTYTMLWGPNASLIGMMSRDRRYGDYDTGGRDAALTAFEIEAWAPTRRFVAVLEGGARVAGSADTVYSYNVPIFGQMWRGRIVRAQAEGKAMVGMINDWRPEGQPYGLS